MPKMDLILFAFCIFFVAKPVDLEKKIIRTEPPENMKRVTEDNWAETLKGEWMIEFMAPWCPACQAFNVTWKKVSQFGDTLNISVAMVDVTEDPGLSGRFFITALPSIYHVIDGTYRQYFGSRDMEDIVRFLMQKEWEELEPVPWWKHPNSIQMSALSLFFQVAMVIRSFYTMMSVNYGIPEWGCYVIFAVLTIITGLLLGLMLVCCCDRIFPPKPPPPQVSSTTGDSKKEDEDGDLIDDVTPVADGEPKNKDDADSTVRKRTARTTD